MKIEGELRYLKREQHDCPDDGVHVTGRDGKIKGVLPIEIDGKWHPAGVHGFYVQLSEELGMKVYYSWRWYKAAKFKHVAAARKNMRKLHTSGLAPNPHNVKKVEIKVTERKGGRVARIKAEAWGLVVDHIHYPEKLMKAYSLGRPYAWALDEEEHPYHCPEGFQEFVKEAREVIEDKGLKVDSGMKLGDILYCVHRKRWYLVDADR